MKKNLVTLMTILGLISCDKETVSENEQTVQNRKYIEIESVINTAGISDSSELKGKLFYSLTNEYTKNYGTPNSIQELTDQVKYISDNWKNKGQELVTTEVNPEYIKSIMLNPNEKLVHILEKSSINKEVKRSLIELIENLIDVSGQDYKKISDFLASYEALVKENTVLTDKDKEIIVNVAVISNYALYAESGRKDRDWETSVANKKGHSFFNPNQAPLITLIALLDRLI
ncbi:hypothetical protein [Flavobacterium gyeonganense]|uniref:Lipoprotein n=1 Tax=Flavobacterium gyeonganense TaxID=1310418 RepID=A0ABV5H9C1_9FLAO|nr:hypothetical protein [Flavobacterium gyeonganense]